jgi:peroxiredoxin Q/BCP
MLPDQCGRDFRLSSLRGKAVVLYFFPEAGTPGCTAEACDLRDSGDAFGDFDAVPVGVSPDPPDRLRRFDREHRLGHVLLSDVGEKVASRWGVSRRPGLRRRLGIGGGGGRGRVTFVIDREGIVRATVGEVDVAGHARQVLDVLEELEAPAATVG